MMRDNAKKPALRFAGFDDDWEQRKFGEITIRAVTMSAEDSLPRVEYEDIISGTGQLNKDIFSKESNKTGIVFDRGDVLYGKLRPYLQNWLLPQFNGLAVGDFWVLQPQNMDSSFLYRLIQTRHFDEIANQSTGTKMPRADWKLVSKSDFFVPLSIDEQRAIGDFFQQLDHLIALHQRKYAKLVNIKKAMLEKMFPQNGSTVPEIRFAGFTGDWELRKLGELGSLKNGMNFSKDAMGHGYAFVNLQNIFGHNVADTDDLGLAEASEKQLIEYSLQKGDVLFVRSSVKLEGVGEAALVPENLENTTYSGFIIRFRDEYGLNDDFKKFIFSTKKVRDQIMSQATNSANKNISQSVLENLLFEVPSYEEQQKIGEYFSSLNHLITLHQRKLERLQNIKKACLEKMFV